MKKLHFTPEQIISYLDNVFENYDYGGERGCVITSNSPSNILKLNFGYFNETRGILIVVETGEGLNHIFNIFCGALSCFGCRDTELSRHGLDIGRIIHLHFVSLIETFPEGKSKPVTSGKE